MASIERTAYPRFPRVLTLKDLQSSFSPRSEETEWAQNYARRPDRRLALLVQLKCFQFLHYFPLLAEIPAEVVEHVSATLGMPFAQQITYPAAHTALYRHHKAIRTRLGVKPFTDARARVVAMGLAQEAACVMETRADIINITLEELVRLGYELPVFRTLDEIAEQAHAAAEVELHGRIAIFSWENTETATAAQERVLRATRPDRHIVWLPALVGVRQANCP